MCCLTLSCQLMSLCTVTLTDIFLVYILPVPVAALTAFLVWQVCWSCSSSLSRTKRRLQNGRHPAGSSHTDECAQISNVQSAEAEFTAHIGHAAALAKCYGGQVQKQNMCTHTCSSRYARAILRQYSAIWQYDDVRNLISWVAH